MCGTLGEGVVERAIGEVEGDVWPDAGRRAITARLSLPCTRTSAMANLPTTPSQKPYQGSAKIHRKSVGAHKIITLLGKLHEDYDLVILYEVSNKNDSDDRKPTLRNMRSPSRSATQSKRAVDLPIPPLLANRCHRARSVLAIVAANKRCATATQT